MSGETSAKLDRLQAKILLRTGRKVSKAEIVAKLADRGLREDPKWVWPQGPIRYPIPDRVWQKVLKNIQDWGVETREEDVDRYVYGGPE